jgi:hypothetical protein
MNTMHNLLDSMASDCQLADHAYQLAVASGDSRKIIQAKRFWQQCDDDYQTELKRQFRNAKARQQRRQQAAVAADH